MSETDLSVMEKESIDTETGQSVAGEESNTEVPNDETFDKDDESYNDVDGELTQDTTPDFLSIFGEKKQFDSWEEFSTMFEEFQEITGSVFKPKSAVTAEYANERRIRGAIPDRFVYSRVRMICENYGDPKEGKQLHRKYKGKGCQANVHLGYSRGNLNIVKFYLVHTNHTLHKTGTTPIKPIRAFTFNDELDLIMSRAVLEMNPFETLASNEKWKEASEALKVQDLRLKTMAPRILRKRVRFLMDRYAAKNGDKEPLDGDELGTILYTLNISRDNVPNLKDDRPKSKRGRKRKVLSDSMTAEDSSFYDEEKDLEEELSEEEEEEDESIYEKPRYFTKSTARQKAMKAASTKKRGRPKKYPQTPNRVTEIPTAGRSSSSPTKPSEVASLLAFLKRKEEQDRKMRQDEMNLRKEELALHKRELELQQSRFDSHLNLLKSQYEEMSKQADVGISKKDLQYTIQVINPEDLEQMQQ